LTNLQEYQLHTDPRDFDTDHDGMADGWEVTYDFDPLDPSDAAEDADNDGLTNLQEYQHDSDPQVPDTDTDGVEDGDEALRDRTDPTNPDRTPPAIHLITPVNGSRKVVVP
jgi:clumping factor A